MNFYSKLNTAELSPASLLYKWFGKREWDKIATDTKYNIMPMDFASGIAYKIWTVFAEVAKNLEKLDFQYYYGVVILWCLVLVWECYGLYCLINLVLVM